MEAVSIRCVRDEAAIPLTGTIGSIDCGSATNTGVLVAAVSPEGVSSTLNYTGGNGEVHNGQEVASTGVLGLKASFPGGYFANGNGVLTYIISGKAQTSGTANFLINIGGKTCTLTRTINTYESVYPSSVTDVDGNTYYTVKIGKQLWINENLKTSKYNDGTIIENITDNTQWKNTSTGAWANYNNDPANNNDYGKLYNAYVLSLSINGNKNVCPTGWHVPTSVEWNELVNNLGSSIMAGGRMKSNMWQYWKTPFVESTVGSGFNAKGGGYRKSDGTFWEFKETGNWAGGLTLRYDSGFSSVSGSSSGTSAGGSAGVSIRCLKD
jgi:uncharacterized protein (TIGR02145 family)